MRLRTLVALGVLTVVVLTLLTQFGIPTTFSTSAETQVVTVVVANGFRHEWFLNGATLTLTGSDGTNERSVLSDAIRPLPGAKVTLSRIGSGPLVLVIEGKDKQPVVILPGERTFTGRVDVVHRLSSDHDLPGRLPTVLPVSGRITLGAEVNDGFSERPLMLLEGSTTMLSHTVLGSLR